MHMGNAVTPVILGLLAIGPRSGYEIKATVDRSTRFFWAASYGQIYPELRRLEREGLIEGENAPTGARSRRVYRLTKAGRKELESWLTSRETSRSSSGTSRFCGSSSPTRCRARTALQLLEGRRRGHERYLAALREIDALPARIRRSSTSSSGGGSTSTSGG